VDSKIFKTEGRLYVNAIATHRVEEAGADVYGKIDVAKAREILGAKDAIAFDPDAVSFYVRESFLKASGASDKEVRAKLSGFLNKESEKLVQTYNGAHPPVSKPDAIGIPVERRVPIFVPKVMVDTDGAGGFTLKRGLHGGVVKGADWTQTELAQFGASHQWVRHMYDHTTGIEGLMVVDSAQVEKSKDFKKWVQSRQTPEAIAETVFAAGLSESDLKRVEVVRERASETPGWVRFSIQDGLARGNLRSAVQNAAFGKPNEDGLFRLYRSLEQQADIFGRQLEERTKALGNQMKAMASAKGGPIERGDTLQRVDEKSPTINWNEGEKALIAAHAINLGLDPTKHGLKASDVQATRKAAKDAGPKSEIGQLIAGAPRLGKNLQPSYDRLVAAAQESMEVFKTVHAKKFPERSFADMYAEQSKLYGSQRNGRAARTPAKQATNSAKGRVGRSMFQPGATA
jgi:hypothetical protein